MLEGTGEITHKQNSVHGRTLEAHAVVYLTAGSGWYHDPRCGRQAVRAGDLLLLFPGQEHSYGPDQPGDWSEYWLMFSGPLYRALEHAGLLDHARPVWHPGLSAHFLAEFSALHVAFQAPLREPAVLAAQVHLLLAHLARADVNARGPQPAWLIASCAALARDLHVPPDLSRIARQAGMSYERFRKAFAAATGMPPLRWRLHRRMDQAKHLLMAGMAIPAIADELGFCDAFFFSRQFRLVTGTTPAAFRGKPQRAR
jgi:AraC-like DNA-binding protein